MLPSAPEPSPYPAPRQEGWPGPTAGGGSRPSWSPAQLAGLLAITLLAGALRMWQVDVWSLAHDEALTWRDATRAVPEGLGLLDRTLRALFEHGILPSHGEGWLRLPFVTLGLLAVPLLAFVGAPYVGRRAGLLAAALLAVHPWHVAASQTATGHAPAATFGLLAFALGGLGRRDRRWPWLLAPIPFAVAGLSHPSAWLLGHGVLVGLFCAARGVGDRGSRTRLLVIVATVLAGTVGLALALRPVGVGASGLVAFALLPRFVGAASLLVLVAAAVPGLGAGREAPIRFLVAVVLAPLAVALAVGVGALPVVGEDLLVVLPPLLLLAALGVVRAFEHLRRALGGGRTLRVLVPSALCAAVLLLDLVVGTFLYGAARHGGRPDWRTARDVVLRRAERSHLVVLAERGHASLLYYLRPNHWRAGELDPHPGFALVPVAVATLDLTGYAATAAERGADLYCVLLEGELAALRRDPDARARLAQSFRLIEVLPNAAMGEAETVYVFRLGAPE